MPYTLHFHDDTDDKPQQLSEENALRVIGNYYVGEAIQEQRWQEPQRGDEVFVRAGRLVRATNRALSSSQPILYDHDLQVRRRGADLEVAEAEGQAIPVFEGVDAWLATLRQSNL